MNTIDQRKEKNNNNKNENDNSRKNTDSTTSNATKDDGHSDVVVTGHWTSAWHGSYRYCGWSPDGSNLFNKLVKIVQQDWAADMHF